MANTAPTATVFASTDVCKSTLLAISLIANGIILKLLYSSNLSSFILVELYKIIPSSFKSLQ